jgi:pre-mRNA-splicing factor CDC5/CEF1
MDEDEKEMLSEARARLANTQGKKAKRKAREKQLEEARRLSTLQKKRELKAAGIELPKFRRNRRGVDYLNEVPFEIKPAAGFYATGKNEHPAVPTFKQSMALQSLEGKRRDDIEAEERRLDKQRQKRKQEKSLPEHVEAISRMNDAEQVRKRSKLSLSSPQVSEQELEQIGKMQDAGILHDGEGGEATRTLMGDYTDMATPSLVGRTPMRTPKSDGDTLMKEAQDLIALTQTRTPLEGGTNAALHKEHFAQDGATPQHKKLETPNPIATPLRTPGVGMTPAGTPAGRGMALSTPVRDELAINDSTAEAGWQAAEQKNSIKGLFSSLPKPSNDYQIDADAFTDVPEDADVPDGHIEEDAAEVAERNRKALKAAEETAMSERSATLRRKLPRPISCTEENMITTTSGKDKPEYMVQKEILDMINDDNTRFPIRATTNPAEMASYALKSKSCLMYFSKEQLTTASNLVKEELVNYLMEKDLSADADSDDSTWLETVADLVHLPTQNRWGSKSKAKPAEVQAALNQQFDSFRQQMTKDAKKANKMEKRLMTLTQGYEKRATQLIKETQKMYEEYQQAQTDLQSFQRLEASEAVALPRRMEALNEEIEVVTKREADLQQRYARLQYELANIQ